MTHSESIANIAKALSLFHIKVETIKKDANNPFFKSTYASLSNILDSIKEPLMESGLSIAQFPHKERTLITLLMHGESGEWIESFYEMTPVKDDPQGRGSVLTYQRRYALSAILLLNIDDDDDGNASSYVGQKTEAIGLPWLNDHTDAFNRAKEKIRSGEITLDVVKQHYKISKKIESLLTGKQS